MRFLLKNLALFFLACVLIVIQLTINTYLLFPWSSLNIIMVAMLSFLLFQQRNNTNWTLAIILGLLMEVLTSTTHFVLLFSWLVSVGLVAWLLQRVLTNRSAYIIFLLSALATTMFEGSQLLILSVFHYFSKSSTILFQPTELVFVTWSILITTIFATTLFIVASILLKRFNPAYIALRR